MKIGGACHPVISECPFNLCRLGFVTNRVNYNYNKWFILNLFNHTGCDDPDVQTCNCDANDDEWRKDRGDLSDKSTLPVTELRFGDTGSEKEKIVYRLGALKCWGIGELHV